MKPSTKECLHCGNPISSTDGYFGTRKYCSDSCRVMRSRAHRRKTDPAFRRKESKAIQKMVKDQKSRSREEWLRHTIRCAGGRALARGIPFDLVVSDVEIPSTCPVLGIPLVYLSDDPARTGRETDAPQLDRKIPDLGYVKGNVRIISARANRLKNNATFDEIVALYVDAKDIQSQQLGNTRQEKIDKYG